MPYPCIVPLLFTHTKENNLKGVTTFVWKEGSRGKGRIGK